LAQARSAVWWNNPTTGTNLGCGGFLMAASVNMNMPAFITFGQLDPCERQTSTSDGEESTSSSSETHAVGPHDEPARIRLENMDASTVSYHPGEMLLKSVEHCDPSGALPPCPGYGGAGGFPFLPPATIPRIGSASVPSVGSLGHHFGTCKPCAFATTKGCRDGPDCKFCHLCDSRERQRRKKAKRALLGAFSAIDYHRPRNVMRSYIPYQGDNAFGPMYGYADQ